jgi:hypothetical protein
LRARSAYAQVHMSLTRFDDQVFVDPDGNGQTSL